MTLNTTLEKIGLNEKEIKLYLTLLRRGKSKPSELAILTKINRATVYNTLSSLASKGLVAEDASGATAYFTPLPPENLSKLADDARRDVVRKEELIKDAVGALSLISAERAYPIPKMRLVTEEHLEKFLFDNTTKWQDAVIAGDGVWWAFQDISFAERYQSWIDSTWTKKQSKHLHYETKIFSNKSHAELSLAKKFNKGKRFVRILSDIDFTANVWVCGDYLVMIVTEQHPSYLIEIHDTMLAHNVGEILKKLWNKSL